MVETSVQNKPFQMAILAILTLPLLFILTQR